MDSGKFYFIKNEYYEKFSNCGLMGNKSEDEYGRHGRPCFYCFAAEEFYWMIPISSKVEKYEAIYNEKTRKYPVYDGIRFGYVNGNKRAFLIQNICPITNKYIADQYCIENNTVKVTINQSLKTELNSLARKVIRFYKRGKSIVLTDLNTIIDELRKDIIE